MEEVANSMWPQAILPFTYMPASAKISNREACVPLNTRSWLWCWLCGLTLSEKVGILYHGGFLGLGASWLVGGSVTVHLTALPSPTVWKGHFGGREPSANTEGFMLLRKCGGPIFFPSLSCQQMVLDVDLAFTAEILPALSLQRPAANWDAKDDVGRQCGSQGKPVPSLCWISVLGILGGWAQDSWYPVINSFLPGLPKRCSCS